MAAIELYTPQGAEMVSGMMYEPHERGNNAPWAPLSWWIRALYKSTYYYYYYYHTAGYFQNYKNSVQLHYCECSHHTISRHVQLSHKRQVNYLLCSKMTITSYKRNLPLLFVGAFSDAGNVLCSWTVSAPVSCSSAGKAKIGKLGVGDPWLGWLMVVLIPSRASIPWEIAAKKANSRLRITRRILPRASGAFCGLVSLTLLVLSLLRRGPCLRLTDSLLVIRVASEVVADIFVYGFPSCVRLVC